MAFPITHILIMDELAKNGTTAEFVVTTRSYV